MNFNGDYVKKNAILIECVPDYRSRQVYFKYVWRKYEGLFFFKSVGGTRAITDIAI